ncbi:hypothetical protein NML43_18520 [Rhodopseudomonas palustris]|uniref:hypothetical protein n=1 Tax=Rhodopseudomonas palustris TaxID=1076 RepID=UPI0020CCBC8E|nr:hypothetical protein [Rhodopseudomonas palustris]MCP9629094.1 hypothetical protein [Rhodopseudomonas palustris]
MADRDLAGQRHEAGDDAESRGNAGKATSREADVKSEPNPAGPHTKPELTDESKTPGSGMLSDPGDSNEAPSG